MSNELLLQVDNVSKKFCKDLKKSLWYGLQDITGDLFSYRKEAKKLRPKEFWALSDISFELRRGESLGLIGSNGAGKSTLLKLLNGLIMPDQGRIAVRGRVGALIELGAGFNPILTGRENIYVNAAVLGISKRQVDQVIDEIIDFADLEEFIDAPVQSYSSGMRVRLGFAVAAQLKPDILIVDEVLAVGDAYFRRKCINYMQKLFESSETTVILVSHNLRNIEQVCERVIYLERGNIIAQGQTDQVISKYLYNSNTHYAERTAKQAFQQDGSGEIRFTEVTINSTQSDRPQVHAGEPITIRAKFKVFKPVKFVRFRIGIQDFSTQTLITLANVDATNLDKDGEIVCTFPEIYLYPRTYSIYLSATDLLLLLERQSNAMVFTIEGARDESVKFSVDDPQLLRLPHSIHLNSNGVVSQPENV